MAILSKKTRSGTTLSPSAIGLALLPNAHHKGMVRHLDQFTQRELLCQQFSKSFTENDLRTLFLHHEPVAERSSTPYYSILTHDFISPVQEETPRRIGGMHAKRQTSPFLQRSEDEAADTAPSVIWRSVKPVDISPPHIDIPESKETALI